MKNGLRFLTTDGTGCLCDILDKESAVRTYIGYMFNRTSQMFEYDDLNETIPQYILEFYFQYGGDVGITKVNGELYAFQGNPGGPPDVYYRPTYFVVANPALKYSKTCRIVNHGEPADTTDWRKYPPLVYGRNDTHAIGLYPLFLRYATQLAENDVSIRSAQINARMQSLISASSDRELASAREYINNLEAGKLSTVAENAFLEGIKVQSVGDQGTKSITQLIELHQYLKAGWYNDIGLNAAFNMKKEYISDDEIAASDDVLLPLADDMLYQRQKFCEAVNAEFGTNWKVRKSSSWDNKEKERDQSISEESEPASEGEVKEDE